MRYMQPQKQTSRVTSGIFFSLLIHFIAGLFVLSGLSHHIPSSSETDGLKLVWIALDHKKPNVTEAKNIRRVQRPDPAVQRTDGENSDLAARVNQPESFPRPAFKSASFSSTGIPAKNEMSEEMQTNSYNRTGYVQNESTADPSDRNTVIAYPLYRENSPPAYPAIARVRGYEGVVLVSAEILPDGRVGEVKIRKSSGYAILDQSAIKAVKPWKFEPARKSGHPFTAWVELPIRFILQNNS